MSKPSQHQRAEHQRRYRQAFSSVEFAVEWCADRVIALTIRNDGQHWSFTRGDQLVEWWPSSGKVVVNKRWNSAKHADNWKRLVPILEKNLRERTPVKAFGITAKVADELEDATLSEWSEHAFDWDAEACPFDVRTR
jgi:hypothetical protein